MSNEITELDVMSWTGKELALSLRFAMLAPTNADARLVIRECMRRLELQTVEDTGK